MTTSKPILKKIEEAQKGDRVEITYRGEKVTGKVMYVKKDGTVTVATENHSDPDVDWVDVRPPKKTS